MNFSQFSTKDQKKFAANRCLDPNASETTVGWYRINDSCPCSTQNSNISGRGFVSCPLGLNTEQDNIATANPLAPLLRIENSGLGGYLTVPVSTLPNGSQYPQQQYVPSQYQPRALMRIGYDYRSAY